MTASYKKVIDWLLLATLFLAVAGTTVAPREFVKLKVGPFYALEIALGLAAVLILLSQRRWDLRGAARALWPAAAFAAWGAILLAFDLAHRAEADSPAPLQRILQHCILFIYPVCWMSVGYWLEQQRPDARIKLSYLVLLLCGLPNLAGLNVTNISLGPLLAVPFLLRLHQARSAKSWMIALALGLVVFLPFWRMWTFLMQRTSLLLLLGLMAVIPPLVASHGERLVRALRTTAIAFSLLLAGLAASTALFYSGGFLDNFLASMQHGEDVPDSESGGNFQFRVRASMWHFAVSDWKTHPLTGVGFIPEVPSSILPGVPNIGGFEKPGAPPLSGPHNSYLSTLVRMGPLGLALCLVILFQLGVSTLKLASARPLGLPDLLLLSIPWAGLVHALFNVGLESPHHCMILWLFAGALQARGQAAQPHSPRR